MKKLIAPGVTMRISDPAKSCPNRRPFDHVHNIFGYVNFSFPTPHSKLGIDFTLKNGDTFVYCYNHEAPAGDTSAQPIIDRLNVDGCYYNCQIRPQLTDKIGPT
jgi:hypothetical protein